MARTRILNPAPVRTQLDAIDLSRQILAEARALRDPAQCARLDALTGQLHGVGPERIDGDAARIAFWANLYNALVLHCLCLKPLRGSLLWHLRLFDRIAYRVGDQDYPPNLIENGVLRANRRAPLRWRRPLRSGDPRLAAAPSRIDPRIHFALNCGARSCPPIRDYEPETLDAQLELATRSYLEAETVLERERGRVRLPRLMRLYAADFGDRAHQLELACRYLPPLADWLRETEQGVRVGYSRFDWVLLPPGTDKGSTVERHLITLHAFDRERAAEVLPALAQALGDGTLGMPDEGGMIEVELSADSREEALERVRDAIAAAGAEERLTFPETTGTGYEPPGARAAQPDEQPEPEPPHLERGSPREEGPAPSDEP